MGNSNKEKEIRNRHAEEIARICNENGITKEQLQSIINGFKK